MTRLSGGHRLCIVNTGGNHADLTGDYADITAEMGAVAALFGKAVLREVDEEQFLLSIATVREQCGDRAVLRALHFFDENRRAVKEKEALQAGDFDRGSSPWFGLRAALPICICRMCILRPRRKNRGCRWPSLYVSACWGKEELSVYTGGGFAGTVQAFVPDDLLEHFINEMEVVFGDESAMC